MCTIVVANHMHKQMPLIIAANRDEDYARVSTPQCVFSNEPNLIVGGKDEEKGGTWLAVNKHSLFAAITNQGTKDKAKTTSRGSIVLDALKCKTIDEMIEYVEGFNPSTYNGFNLIFGNQEHMFIAHSYILHSMVISELPKGVSIITNDMTFIGPTDKTNYVHDTLNGAFNDDWLPTYKTLKKFLANEDYVKIRPTKKNGKLQGRCTRSSSVLAFGQDGLERYKFHDRASYVIEKKKAGSDAHIPRYRDYVDLWRNPDTFVADKLSSEENEKDDVNDEAPDVKKDDQRD